MNTRTHRLRPGLLALALLAGGAGCKGSSTILGGAPDGSDGGAGNDCDPLSRAAHLDCKDPDVAAALALLASLSLEERVQQMSGPTYNPNNMFDQEDNKRVGIPGFKYMDGPRGVRWYNSDYGTTVYPVAAARASSWNVDLERLIGKMMAREMRSLGRHVLLAPTINQVSHPRWGRAQESYGEDSFLLGEMGAALIKGVQYDPAARDPADPDQPIESTYRIQSCVKHFAANNIEDTRIYVNALLDDRTLREVYLPHFRKAVEAGVSCVMTSYNRVNGSYSGYSKALVRDILKGEWGYSGFTISDWFAKGNTLNSPVAGLDVEMPFSAGPFPSQFDSAYFYGSNLSSAVNSALVDKALVDQAALRILHAKIHSGVIKHPAGWAPYQTKSDAAQALSLASARQGIVLLKNGPTRALADDVLPLKKAAVRRIAVVGKFASSENMGDKGSSDAKVVEPALVMTPFKGLQAALEGTGATVSAFTEVAGNEAALKATDVILVVAAYFYADLARSSSGEEGEWKDRVSMSLPARDLTNIQGALALKAQNPALKVIVQVKAGGAVVVKDFEAGVDAIVHTWYGGMKEGTALAEVLFGDVNPSGKLCQSFPVEEADLPPFLNSVKDDVPYDYFHGYRWLEKKGKKPQYPFGFGLSYTTYAYSNLKVATPTIGTTGTLSVSVDVKNTGPVAGSEVVELYVGYDKSAVGGKWGRPVKDLKAFARTSDIAPGETRTVQLGVKASDLAYWDEAARRMTVEKMTYQLFVGPSSDSSDPAMQVASFTVQ